jgi:putative nucleotidyltransferase with HDIG domain
MKRTHRKASLYSQKIDRVAFITYFLGAVVPLVALAVVANHYALPNIDDRNAAIGLIAAVLSIGVLSLASFLILRHTTRSTLARMKSDNARLATLLGVSSKLAGAQHVTDVTARSTRSALELAGAPLAYVFLRGEAEDGPNLAEAGGKNASKVYEKIHRPLAELVDAVFKEDRPALRGAPDGSDGSASGFSAAVVPIPGESAPFGALAVVRPSAAPFLPSEIDALSTLAALLAVSLHNADLRDSQRNFFSHVTDIIVHALDSHLGYHTGHGERVAQISNRIGRVMGLDDARMERLHFGALLHDIGMLKIDRSQQMNRKVCEKHSLLGHRMLSRIRLWQDLGPFVLHHHEWYDGNGYPEGLAGDAIPLEARIIGLAEAFDTMTNEASYRETISLEEAMREIAEGTGTQFDPQVVEAFRQLVDQGVIEV